MGRPTKCTPELTAAIAADVSQGIPGEVAAEARGVSRSTFYCWLKWGKRGEPGFVDFLDAIKRARAQAEAHYIGIVRVAAATTWQAAAWILERRAPRRWGRWGPWKAPEKPPKSSAREELEKLTEEELLEELRRAVTEAEQSISEKQQANATATPGTNGHRSEGTH